MLRLNRESCGRKRGEYTDGFRDIKQHMVFALDQLETILLLQGGAQLAELPMEYTSYKDIYWIAL